MLAGLEDEAHRVAVALQAHISEDRLRLPQSAEGAEAHAALELHVLMRFGHWARILEWPAPVDPVLYCATIAQRHFARGIAFAALGRVDEAKTEQEHFRKSREEPMLATRRVHNNMCSVLLEIGEQMLAGEILYREKEYDAAFERLAAGVALEDRLAYDEPW